MLCMFTPIQLKLTQVITGHVNRIKTKVSCVQWTTIHRYNIELVQYIRSYLLVTTGSLLTGDGRFFFMPCS